MASATCSSMRTDTCSSVTKSPIRSTPKGRFVSVFVCRTRSRRTSGGLMSDPIVPSPPASQTAAASAGRAIIAMPALTMGVVSLKVAGDGRRKHDLDPLMAWRMTGAARAGRGFVVRTRAATELGHRLIQAELAPHIDQHAGKSGAQVGNDLADEGFDLARRGRRCKLGHDPVPLRSHGTAGSGRILCRLR